MISTLALLGFLALIFLLAYRIVIACEGHNHIRKQRRPRQHELASRKIEQEKPESSSEQRDILVPVRQV